MPGLRTVLRLENVSSSVLGDVSEVVSEPVTPLSLTLLNYILNGETSPLDGSEHEEFVTQLGLSSRQLYEPESTKTTESMYQYVSDRVESISKIYAVDGDIYLSLEVKNRSELRDLCADIEKRFGPVSIDRITNIEDADGEPDYGRVDLRKLTDRQYEVVETAYQMGYFGYPRDANAEEIAASLGISSSTFTEHLNTAQAKIFEGIFQEE